MTDRFPLLIGHEIYRHSTYGRRHPLAIPRVSTAIDLARAMGWLPARRYVESPQATRAQLCRFHDADYVTAVAAAERAQAVDDAVRRRFDLGGVSNPVFPEMFRRPATAAGGSIRAAELIAEGGIVYNPAGGTHHGLKDRASGFCYFNDPVLGILTLLDQGLERIYYVDLDAHHGDGVEAAFADDDRVLTVSIHETDKWPFTGGVEDRAGGLARNLPVPKGFNDTELAAIRDRVLLPLGERFDADAVVIQGGADAVLEDPLSRLALSNRALWDTVAALRSLAPRLLLLGGGGYNPWSVGRAWAGMWGTLMGADTTQPPTPDAQAVLRGLRWEHRHGRAPPEAWFTTLADPPRPGPVRVEVEDGIATVLRP